MSALTFAQERFETPEDEPAWDELAEALNSAIDELQMAQRVYARGDVLQARAAIREAILLLGGQP